MNREELLEELTQDVLAYVMHGSFPERHFINEIKPAELDERFVDYEELIKLHFILRPELVDFVEALPTRLRQIKTQTENVSRTSRGAIQGRINWTKTVKNRYTRNPYDHSLFVCENRHENYDVDENVVLKKLLSVIYHTLVDAEKYLKAEYDWVTDRWQENLSLVDTMKDIFERNVHVTRIRSPEFYEPTERMLQAAEKARSPVYRDAAQLLRELNESLSGNESAIYNLLDTTAITPDDDETLFELFVLFKYIGAIESLQEEQFRLQTIASDKQEIARLDVPESEVQIVLYHDNSARDRGVSFDAAPKKDGEPMGRHETVHEQSVETARQYFKNDALGSQTGRPDVIVLEISREDTREYLITEVKYSKRQETVRQGIKETLEYLAFLRQDDEFVFDTTSDFLGSGWNGLLVIQDIEETETASFDEQEGQPIRILQASEIERHLTTVLETVL